VREDVRFAAAKKKAVAEAARAIERLCDLKENENRKTQN